MKQTPKDPNDVPYPDCAPTWIIGNVDKQLIFSGEGILDSVEIWADVVDATHVLYDQDGNCLWGNDAIKAKADALGGFRGGALNLVLKNGLKITTANFAGGLMLLRFRQ